MATHNHTSDPKYFWRLKNLMDENPAKVFTSDVVGNQSMKAMHNMKKIWHLSDGADTWTGAGTQQEAQQLAG